MKLTKTLVTGSILSLAFLANCDFIFGSDWKFGDAEMRAAVEGTWKLTRQDETITLVAKQATAAKQSARDHGFVKSAAACGSRSFVKQASACVDLTSMPLEIAADKHEIKDATLEVHSTTFERGLLRFKLDGASIDAELDPRGKVEKATLYVDGKPQQITLERVAVAR